MPRIAGQIDLAKTQAILDAAAEVFAQRGLTAGLDDIARRAGVSKQTIYNHYGSKTELVRALATRRVREVTAALDLPGAVENPRAALVDYARQLLNGLANSRAQGVARLAILSVGEMPELAKAIYEAGPQASRSRLAEFLQQENAAGRIDAPDPPQASAIFASMAIGPYQLETLIGIGRPLSAAEIDQIAEEVVTRFLRAYAPA